MHDRPAYCEFIPEFESGKPEIKSEEEMKRQSITGSIRKIHLFYRFAQLGGIRFYDKDGKLIYESAYKFAFTSSLFK